MEAPVPSGVLLGVYFYFFFFQAEDGIRDYKVTGVQTCALPISELSLPVETGRGDPRVRQPEQRDVVEHVVPRQPFSDPVEAARNELEAACVVVDHEGGQADR